MPRLPELGPALGRLCAPSPAAVAADPPLDEVRLELATSILELAGTARDTADASPEAAVAAVRGQKWLPAWERAINHAVDRTVAAIERAFDNAAAESRFPRRKRAALTITAEERAVIHARLGAGGAPFLAALEKMDALAGPASAKHLSSSVARDAWWRAVEAAARRLEAAWIALEAAARRERQGWLREADKVRGWRRPIWPLWSLTAGAVAAAVYLGLILGGYLPVPSLLRPIAEFWWRQVPWA